MIGLTFKMLLGNLLFKLKRLTLKALSDVVK